MKYYKERNKAFDYIENMIKSTGNKGIEPTLLVYNTIKRFEVGKLTLKRQIDDLISIGKVKLENGVLKWTTA